MCELLRANLYEFQKYNREAGDPLYFTLPRVQAIARQVRHSSCNPQQGSQGSAAQRSIQVRMLLLTPQLACESRVLPVPARPWVLALQGCATRLLHIAQPGQQKVMDQAAAS